MRFKALHVPHCHPFKHGFYLTGAQSAPSFVNPPYCVETPPGTRYNPPFNISENLFFNRSNRYKEPKMNPARKK
ncbi:hypothetical protein CPE73_11720, partial [Neisseria gonorrhoeae]